MNLISLANQNLDSSMISLKAFKGKFLQLVLVAGEAFDFTGGKGNTNNNNNNNNNNKNSEGEDLIDILKEWAET